MTQAAWSARRKRLCKASASRQRLRAALARWQGTGMRMHMAVNVSMENLRAPDFVRRVQAIVRHSGMSPQDVVLEVTESWLMSPSPVPLETLIRLRMQRLSAGVGCSASQNNRIAIRRPVGCCAPSTM